VSLVAIIYLEACHTTNLGASLRKLMQWSAWKSYSANFAMMEF